MTNPSRYRDEFDCFADRYTELLHDPIRDRFSPGGRFFYQRKLQVIQSFFHRLGKDTRTMSWLDIGCGQGDLLRLGQAEFRLSAGCDPSERMLAACADLPVRHQSSPDRLPFDNETFDFATAVCVYHHVLPGDRASFTEQVLNVLKPGGVLCIIEHNPINPVTRFIVSRTPVDADAHLLSARETCKLVSDAGGGILACRYFLFLPEKVHAGFSRLEELLAAVPLGGQYAIFAQRMAG
jgi:SAM-dependent methyltransferase